MSLYDEMMQNLSHDPIAGTDWNLSPAAPAARRERTIQRTVTACPPALRALYWRAETTRGAGQHPECILQDDGSIIVGRDTILSFDTYFGAFFERHWRANTRLGSLTLRVRVEGRCRLRLWRRSELGEWLVGEAAGDDDGVAEIVLPRETVSHRQHGVLCFDVTPLDQPIIFRGAEWISHVAESERIGLAAVFCTFNREADIGRVLNTLADAPEPLAALARVYVVNQGRPGLAAHPAVSAALPRFGEKLRIVEQANYGGAGGFTRGILEALRDPGVTHVVLLDDDIRFEPESLARMAAFFALAARDMPVGGHMLDLVQPTRLFEAGATIADYNWSFQPRHHMLDLRESQSLINLVDMQPVHYNGWWCFGVPLRLVREAGLPLPCFIRGDDMEYGLRLHQRGIHTVPVPGIAVWHEPFYLKLGGWQLYYETRNMLVAAALHFEFGRMAVAERMIRHFLTHLLTFRYYSAALIVRGIRDFLRGPSILHEDPRALHDSLRPLLARYPPSAIARLAVLDPAPVRPPPRSRLGRYLLLTRVLLQNCLLPVGQRRPRRMSQQDFFWFTLADHDEVALDTGWDEELPVFRRSRRMFREIGRSGVGALVALFRTAPSVARRWREAAPQLVCEDNWRAYLGLTPALREPAAMPAAARLETSGRLTKTAAAASE